MWKVWFVLLSATLAASVSLWATEGENGRVVAREVPMASLQALAPPTPPAPPPPPLPPAPPPFVGEVNILNHLLGFTALEGADRASADFNGSGDVDVGDMVAVVNAKNSVTTP